MIPAPASHDSPWRLVSSLICAMVCVGASGGWIADAFNGLPPDLRYGVPTAILVLTTVALAACWPDHAGLPGTTLSPRLRRLVTLVVLGLGVWAFAAAVSRMLPKVFAGRISSFEADMLVVIELGVRRFLGGANPYTIYQVPWDVPLPYGPYLWGPYAVPITLNADPRILTLVASHVVPGACVWAAIACGRHGRLPASGLFLALSAVLLLQPAVLHFFLFGHTQVYWPLLLVFAWLLRAERWTAAAATLGTLVVARTTMVALVPVFVMFLWHRRLLTIRRLLVLTAAAGLPFLPFLVADAGSLWYALYGSYQKVMKEFVWPNKGAHVTLGVTGFLLRHGAERHVELAQAAGLSAVYAGAWRALGHGGRPEPWLILALLTFSMTTLWPVIYVYFDVFVLIAAALASSVLAPSRSVRELVVGTAALIMAPVALVLAIGAYLAPARLVIDVGTPSAARFLERGFERTDLRDGERTYGRIQDGAAALRIPRASRSAGSIRVVGKAGSTSGAQRVSAWLNGHLLGHSILKSDWDEVVFHAPSTAWFYGVNNFELRFTSTLASGGADGGAVDGPRGAALDMVKIEP